jgi:hypothetical protein
MRRSLILIVTVVLAFGSAAAVTPVAGAAVPPSPIGSFDGVSARFDSNVVVSGWAADADALDQPIAVRLYLGPTFVAQISTGDPRPDVAARMHGVGQSTGWHATITPVQIWSAQSGTVLCAYAINVGAGENNNLGCRNLQVSGPSPYNPVGNLEQVTTRPGLVTVRGWAGDPDGGPVTRLRIYFNGVPVSSGVTNRPRPDVQALGLGPTAGFSITLPLAPPGGYDPVATTPFPLTEVQVCVYAENSGPLGNQNGTVGCAQRTRFGIAARGPHDPDGRIDGPDANVQETGWAYDPDSSGPVTVEIRKYFYPGFERHYGRFTTGLPRPDAFNIAGPHAGFAGEPRRIDVSSKGMQSQTTAAGPVRFVPLLWWACAYVVNVGPGSNRFIGCHADGGVVKVG